MKQLKRLSVLLFAAVFALSFPLMAQKDTTELKVGKKKLMIVNEKVQKENAAYNLQKAKESFEKEFEETQELIEEKEAYIEQQEEFLRQREELLRQQEDLMKEREALLQEEKKILELNKEEIPEEDIIKDELEDLQDVDNNSTNAFSVQKEKMRMRKKEIQQMKNRMEQDKLFVDKEKRKLDVYKKSIVRTNIEICDLEKEMDNLEKEMDALEKQLNKRAKKQIYQYRHPERNNFNAHWAGFELGILNFVNAKASLASDKDLEYLVLIPEKTMLYGLNILEVGYPLSKNGRFGIASGAGMEWNSLALKHNINLYEDEKGKLHAEYIDPNTMKYTKNKLNAVYVTVPLMFEYQKPFKHRKFYVSAGLTGGIRAWSKQKQKYKKNGKTYKNKTVEDFQLSPFRYGAFMAVGYGDIGLFIKCAFTSLFRPDVAPEIYPVSVGIKIIDF